MDSALIANECINSAHLLNQNGILCKIDFQKAYDNVAWSFIDYVLKRMGFGMTWRKWIEAVISHVYFSVLINGSSNGRFKSSKGLRQGDPLSPFLFLIVAESLNLMFTKAAELQWIQGFDSSPGGSKITHLLFGDDTLIFLKNDHRSIAHLRNILIWFEVISEVKINFHKTFLMDVGNVQNLDSLATTLGCKTMVLPSTYLGLPLGEAYRSNNKWDRIIERFEDILPSWMAINLSLGGKLTLILYVLMSLPIYLFSLFFAPINVIKKLEIIIRNFLWDGGVDRKKYHHVAWDIVLKPKNLGGLGVKDLHLMNIALLMKWLWKFGEDDNPLWKNLVSQKYGIEEHGWYARNPKQAYGCSVWRGIQNHLVDFKANCKFIVGNGERIQFWKDIWLGNTPLAEQFPYSFGASSHKDLTIAQMYNTSENSWLLGITRRIYDHVIICFAGLLHALDE